MPRQSPSSSKRIDRPDKAGRAAASKPAQRPLRVLVVAGNDAGRMQLSAAAQGPTVNLAEADSMAQAQQRMADDQFDLAVIDVNLPDGDGVELACELAHSDRNVQTILVTDQADFQQAVRAMRLGVSDLLVRPIDEGELADRVRHAMARRQIDLEDRRKLKKLQRTCKKLDLARKEVTEQVDILCNDLVTAYQELAEQMQQVVHTSEFSGVIRDELDLESLLRKTLEFIIQKAGPTNAALFLPSTCDEFTLGGYVNYDCTGDSADILLEHLSDVVAPRLAQRETLAHITDNDTLNQWMGDDAAYLEDSHVVGISCDHQEETLAVLMLFRDGSHPFDSDTVESVAAIAPLLGEYLARIIRVHHRHLPDDAIDDTDLAF